MLIINIVNNESRKKLFTGCCMRKAKLAMAASNTWRLGQGTVCAGWWSEKVASEIQTRMYGSNP